MIVYRLRRLDPVHGLDLASTNGPRQVKYTLSAIYDRLLSSRRKAFLLVSICFADELAKVIQISCLGPEFVPPHYR